MAAVDAIDGRVGRGTLYPVAAGVARPRPALLSPWYTTRLAEMPAGRT